MWCHHRFLQPLFLCFAWHQWAGPPSFTSFFSYWWYSFIAFFSTSSSSPLLHTPLLWTVDTNYLKSSTSFISAPFSAMVPVGFLSLKRQHLKTSVRKLELKHRCVFQMDDDPKHATELVLKCLKDQRPDFWLKVFQ